MAFEKNLKKENCVCWNCLEDLKIECGTIKEINDNSMRINFGEIYGYPISLYGRKVNNQMIMDDFFGDVQNPVYVI